MSWTEIEGVTLHRSAIHPRTWSPVFEHGDQVHMVEGSGPLSLVKAYVQKEWELDGYDFRWRRVRDDLIALDVWGGIR